MRSFNGESVPRHAPISLPMAPFDIEIGAGQGLHAIRYAQQNPQRTLIAIERTHTRFNQLEKRHAKHNLPNLVPLHADAVSVFVHQLPDASIERVFLLYPNPYPKSKQANLRWHNMPFMEVVKQKMIAGGHLTLATNIASYAAEAEREMTGTWKFEMALKQKYNFLPRTHFEAKYLARGEDCWNFVFVKPTL